MYVLKSVFLLSTFNFLVFQTKDLYSKSDGETLVKKYNFSESGTDCSSIFQIYNLSNPLFNHHEWHV